jgi:hypothetical protein
MAFLKAVGLQSKGFLAVTHGEAKVLIQFQKRMTTKTFPRALTRLLPKKFNAHVFLTLCYPLLAQVLILFHSKTTNITLISFSIAFKILYLPHKEKIYVFITD